MHVVTNLARRIRRDRKKERGATVVLVSLSMVALLGMAAISVDYAVASDYKSKVQSGADAAALAMAKHCAVKSTLCNPTTGASEALWYLNQEAPSATGTVTPAPAYANKQVTVTAQGSHQTMFGGLLGQDTLNVAATATASWDATPVKGTPIVPMALGYCDWKDRQGVINDPSPTNVRYVFNKALFEPSTWKSCTGVPRYETQTVRSYKDQTLWLLKDGLPGLDFSNCSFSPNLWDVYSSSINFLGLNVHWGCEDEFARLVKGDTVLMPIYAVGTWQAPWWLGGGSWSNSVSIVGFAPFKLTKFWIGWNILGLGIVYSESNTCAFNSASNFFLGFGNCGAIEGHFVRTARPFEGWEYDTQIGGYPNSDLGAVKVRLVN